MGSAQAFLSHDFVLYSDFLKQFISVDISNKDTIDTEVQRYLKNWWQTLLAVESHMILKTVSITEADSFKLLLPV